jgi:hypothetical protein
VFDYRGLQDVFFIALYCGVAFLAVAACLYLLFRRRNLFMHEIAPDSPEMKQLQLRSPRHSSLCLRRWTAALMAAIAASHVWWYAIGVYWLADVRLVRNIIAISLDYLTFVPLMMCVLVRMLQDRRRPLWPLIPLFLPIGVMAVVCIDTHDESFLSVVECYMAILAVAFIIYYVWALRQYGRWLLDNYADLERKEVWQSLLLLALVLFVHMAYSSNEGTLFMEYLAQVNSIVIIGFLLWRVETLQELPSEEDMDNGSLRSTFGSAPPSPTASWPAS